MQTASVITAGYAVHPQSDKRLLRVTVDHEFASGGIRCTTTDVWCPVDMPLPKFGDALQWGSSHVWFEGVRYRKPEYDSPSDKALV